MNIESGIPAPRKRASYNMQFKKMTPGDSFVLTVADDVPESEIPDVLRRMHGAISSAIKTHRRSNPLHYATTRRISMRELRVWLMSDEMEA